MANSDDRIGMSAAPAPEPSRQPPAPPPFEGSVTEATVGAISADQVMNIQVCEVGGATSVVPAAVTSPGTSSGVSPAKE